MILNEKIYIRTLNTTDSIISFVYSGILTMIALIMTFNIIKESDLILAAIIPYFINIQKQDMIRI